MGETSYRLIGTRPAFNSQTVKSHQFNWLMVVPLAFSTLNIADCIYSQKSVNGSFMLYVA